MNALEDPLKKDFRKFLYVVWEYLQLPHPTPIQYDIANYLQYGPRRRIIKAFRGVGKSWITVAYVLWLLYCNPNKKILVVSASKVAADNFSTFCLQLIYGMPELHHLKPRQGQRDSKVQFDVGPALESKDPSVKSVGITGMMTGSRADVIIPDDIEVPNNSSTQQMRDKLAESIKEFDAILKPGGDIVFLGTPQNEMTVYNILEIRGYSARIWPVKYKSEKECERSYGDNLAPFIWKNLKGDSSLIGKSTEPLRFSDEDLMEREASYGRSGFALQFMMDTSLSDALKFPLKLSDLIVMDLNPKLAPEKVAWATSPELIHQDLAPVGLIGDRFYRPMFVSKENWGPYTGSVMTIDPSGRGQDELAYCVGKVFLGNIFCTALGGLQGGYESSNLEFLCRVAKEHNVNKIIIEKTWGDGMFTELIKPHLSRIYPCSVEEVHHSTQKEKRIIDTLEPVLNQHRLIIDKRVVQLDYSVTQEHYGDRARVYQAFYQMTRITKERGALAHDDRLDALSMMVSYWTHVMARDSEQAVQDHRQELLEKDLRAFMELAGGASQKEPSWFYL